MEAYRTRVWNNNCNSSRFANYTKGFNYRLLILHPSANIYGNLTSSLLGFSTRYFCKCTDITFRTKPSFSELELHGCALSPYTEVPSNPARSFLLSFLFWFSASDSFFFRPPSGYRNIHDKWAHADGTFVWNAPNAIWTQQPFHFTKAHKCVWSFTGTDEGADPRNRQPRHDKFEVTKRENHFDENKVGRDAMEAA